jgi:lipopolysaccharide export LptBFGC system permease protein LptF
MVAELESITDPAERRRFAAGAMLAMLRLASSRHPAATVRALGRFFGLVERGTNFGGPSMPQPTTRQILRRLAVPFAVSFVTLTSALVANAMGNQLSYLSARRATAKTLVEVLLLTLPHTAALTIPMSVFLAVSWAFARLGAEGALAAARREPRDVRRLVTPVVAAAACVSALTLVLNTQVLPRANERLVAVLSGVDNVRSPRTMTIGELRAAARSARADDAPSAPARAAAYEVEIQKKYALAAASIFLALAGAAVALRFPRGGTGLAIVVSFAVFGGYWISLIAGESLADRRMVSPLVAMWTANALLFAVASVLAWRRSAPPAALGPESLATGA